MPENLRFTEIFQKDLQAKKFDNLEGVLNDLIHKISETHHNDLHQEVFNEAHPELKGLELNDNHNLFLNSEYHNFMKDFLEQAMFELPKKDLPLLYLFVSFLKERSLKNHSNSKNQEDKNNYLYFNKKIEDFHQKIRSKVFSSFNHQEDDHQNIEEEDFLSLLKDKNLEKYKQEALLPENFSDIIFSSHNRFLRVMQESFNKRKRFNDYLNNTITEKQILLKIPQDLKKWEELRLEEKFNFENLKEFLPLAGHNAYSLVYLYKNLPKTDNPDYLIIIKKIKKSIIKQFVDHLELILKKEGEEFFYAWDFFPEEMKNTKTIGALLSAIEKMPEKSGKEKFYYLLFEEMENLKLEKEDDRVFIEHLKKEVLLRIAEVSHSIDNIYYLLTKLKGVQERNLFLNYLIEKNKISLKEWFKVWKETSIDSFKNSVSLRILKGKLNKNEKQKILELVKILQKKGEIDTNKALNLEEHF